jgi:hypothetical protein
MLSDKDTRLSTADILNLIRLVELDLQQMCVDLESDDMETSDNAGVMVFQAEALAEKLRVMYENEAPDFTVYPIYEDFIKLIQRL